MAERSPYQPFPSSEPQQGMPSDYLSVRASPNAFGAQVGQATQGLGQTVEGAGKEASQYVLAKQGQLNESFITNADTDYSEKVSGILKDYDSLENAAQVAAYPSTLEAVKKARLDALGTLPNPAAQRGFDILSRRSEQYTLRDLGAKSGTAKKNFNRLAAESSVQQSVRQGENTSLSPEQIGMATGNIQFQTLRQAQEDGYATTVQVDPKTGKPMYDESSDTGINEKAIIENKLQNSLGAFWKTYIQSVSTQDPIKAAHIIDDHKDAIPAPIQAELKKQLQPQIRDIQTRTIADDVQTKSQASYNNYIVKNGYVTRGQWLQENEESLTNQARQKAEEAFPGDVQKADTAEARTQTWISREVSQSQAREKVGERQVMGWLFGDGKGNFKSLDSISSAPALVQQGWRDMQTNNPTQELLIRNRLDASNAKGMAGGYGTDFYKYFTGVSGGSMENDQLLRGIDPKIGKESPLTNSGFYALNKLKTILQDNPNSDSIMSAAKDYFDKEYKNIVAGPTDSVGKHKMTLFMMNALPKFMAGYSDLANKQINGEQVNFNDMFNPDKEDSFIGSDAPYYYRSETQLLNDMEKQSGRFTAKDAADLGNQNKKFDASALDKVIGPKEGINLLKTYIGHGLTQKEAKQLARDKGWVLPNPKPNVGAPIGR